MWPVSDTYIAKTASNSTEEIDICCALGHPEIPVSERRGRALWWPRIQLPSTGFGIPSEILRPPFKFQVGREASNLRGSLRELVNNQYSRNDIDVAAEGRLPYQRAMCSRSAPPMKPIVRIELISVCEVERIRYVGSHHREGFLQSLETVNIIRPNTSLTTKNHLEGRHRPLSGKELKQATTRTSSNKPGPAA